MPAVGEEYGAPLFVIHRGDLQRILLDAARQSGCRILTSHTVTKVDESFSARVQVNNSEWLDGDLVIAADGIRSTVRSQMSEAYGHKSRAIPTGDAAYRLLIPQETMMHDEEAMDLLRQDAAQRWMGPGSHIMAYPVKSNTVYNSKCLRCVYYMAERQVHVGRLIINQWSCYILLRTRHS
jgi:salicylate hydroxylase